MSPTCNQALTTHPNCQFLNKVTEEQGLIVAREWPDRLVEIELCPPFVCEAIFVDYESVRGRCGRHRVADFLGLTSWLWGLGPPLLVIWHGRRGLDMIVLVVVGILDTLLLDVSSYIFRFVDKDNCSISAPYPRLCGGSLCSQVNSAAMGPHTSLWSLDPSLFLRKFVLRPLEDMILSRAVLAILAWH